MIRDARASDAQRIVDIYNPYVSTTVITFEYDEVSAAAMAERVVAVQAQGLPWLVGEDDGRVYGYAYAAPYRPRAAYRHAVEVTIYLDATVTGRGWGRELFAALLDRLRDSHAHSAISLIALPNDASVGLHRSFGFSQVGVLTEVGRKFDRWIDVAYLQLPLDLR